MNKNKGFSLVELIVVVAIMAVLVGILAPAYLSYVEKTRRGTDEDMAEEVRHTIEVAAAEICVYDEVVNGCTVSFTKDASIAGAFKAKSALKESMTDVYGSKNFTIKSKKYNSQTYTVTINGMAGSNAALSVEGSWSASAAASGT